MARYKRKNSQLKDLLQRKIKKHDWVIYAAGFGNRINYKLAYVYDTGDDYIKVFYMRTVPRYKHKWFIGEKTILTHTPLIIERPNIPEADHIERLCT